MTPLAAWCAWLAEDAGLPHEVIDPAQFEDEAREILERVYERGI